MKKKFLAIIMCVITVAASLSCVPASAQDAQGAQGKLTITEINTALDGSKTTDYFSYPNSNSYQYIEVLNNSEADVDLADYYIFRYSYMNCDGAKVWTNLKHLLGDASKARNLHKVKVTDDETILKPGEVALLWLNHTGKVEGDFKTFWSAHAVIPEGVKIVDVNTYGYSIKDAQDSTFGRAGTAFLPIHLVNCIVELVNVNNEYNGVNAETDTATTIADTDLVKARHAAADCLALVITSHETTWDAKDSEMEIGSITSRHFYAYADAEKYSVAASAIAPSMPVDNDICEGSSPAVFGKNKIESYLGNLVHGKLDSDGNYALDEGLAHYVNNITKDTEAEDQHGLFFDDGTKATPTPGVVNLGQFGNTSGDEIPAEGLGGNTGSEENNANGNANNGNNANTDNGTADTQAPNADTAESTAEETEEEKSGCGSVIGGGILAMTVIPVGAVIFRKKKED